MYRQLVLAILAAVITGIATPQNAQAESPFHTGVWQVSKATGVEGLVVSDWLVFENGLPHRWIYRKAGTNDVNRFDYLSRQIGNSNYDPIEVLVYRTGENTMHYSVFATSQAPAENPAIRLSQPDYANSCLSVENKGDWMFRPWVGTRASAFQRLQLSPGLLTIDDEVIPVEAYPVRVGRLGIVRGGVPLAFLTDAGGDYAIVQWFKYEITVEHMLDINREILEYSREDIVRDPTGTCDRQIASRLKLLGTK